MTRARTPSRPVLVAVVAVVAVAIAAVAIAVWRVGGARSLDAIARELAARPAAERTPSGADHRIRLDSTGGPTWEVHLVGVTTSGSGCATVRGVLTPLDDAARLTVATGDIPAVVLLDDDGARPTAECDDLVVGYPPLGTMPVAVGVTMPFSVSFELGDEQPSAVGVVPRVDGTVTDDPAALFDAALVTEVPTADLASSAPFPSDELEVRTPDEPFEVAADGNRAAAVLTFPGVLDATADPASPWTCLVVVVTSARADGEAGRRALPDIGLYLGGRLVAPQRADCDLAPLAAALYDELDVVDEPGTRPAYVAVSVPDAVAAAAGGGPFHLVLDAGSDEETVYELPRLAGIPTFG
jgi:hypothetical protein